jgi:diguanylate cyclase (GGDEF)-like protein/PAS domain S-box-containing protein
MLRPLFQHLPLFRLRDRASHPNGGCNEPLKGTAAPESTSLLTGKAAELEVANARFHVALTHMAHALCMFDAEQRLIVCNQKYAELYGLSPEQTRPGTSLKTILDARVASGNCPEDTVGYIRQRLAEVARVEAHTAENMLRDGRVIVVSHQPIAGGGWVAIHQDVTAQKELERELLQRTKALDESNARFAAALANMSQGLCMFDAEQRIVVVNERYREIYALPPELVRPGTTLKEILEYRSAHGNFRGVDPADYIQSHLDDPIEIQELGNGRVVTILRHKMANGSWLTTHEDITERRRNEMRVTFMAHHDPLTGLLNRAALLERIVDLCARLRRWNEGLSVLMLDLDRFKQVNDTFGHHAGDLLLKQVAERLRASLRETDVLARLGGDEFAIVLANDPDPGEAAQSLAARIIAVLTEPFTIAESEVNIGTSVGIALAPDHSSNADELLKMADLALYQSKSQGRNDYTLFEPRLSKAASERSLLESELRRALQHDEFELLFQPILDVTTRTLAGAEALVRWQHPQRPMLVLPDQFIPAAEESGLITRIGEWVLHAACTEAAKWPTHTKVAVNLSAVQLRNRSLLDVVMYVLIESGLPPERLELEITETALIENGPECMALLHQLKNLGVTIALDDFGTGYSSLSQLTMFPFDKIKIDKSFTQNMTKRADCAAIISAVLALAHSLDIATTAEGVETQDQLRLLSMAGVSSVQGYLIQHPAPASELDFARSFREPKGVEDAA